MAPKDAPPPREHELHQLRLGIPPAWYARLQQLAGERAISVAALIRIYLREALYKGLD
jgi:hypothetical protein